MGKRLSLIATVGLTLAALVATFAAGNTPLLGLDLQGGVSVVLQPTNDVDSETLDQSIEIIRQRVDGLGVAEPEVTRQGDTILVQLPGVDNQQRAVELVGQTAELRFRPVLQDLPPVGVDVPDLTIPDGTTTTAPGGATTTVPATPSTITDGAGEEGSAFPGGGESASGELAQAPTTAPPTTATPPTTTPAIDLSDLDPSLTAGAELPDNLTDEGISPRSADRPGETVVLPERDDDGTIVARYLLGPQLLTGSALEGAEAITDQLGTQWQVNPTFKSGEDGIDLFNAAAQLCNSGAPECPATTVDDQGNGVGRLAIALDGEVISAPAINTPSFERDQITISGSFDESSAKDLALVLRFGALPAELERQDTRTVSATLGKDSLRAGLLAGLIGVGVVTVFMIAFYRLLGLIAILSLLLSSAILWSIISYLGESQGLALTLAGVTGLIVSIGVSLDSNVVYFEHLKEDVRRGRTMRSSVDRSFTAAFSTIVKADLASLIGAGVLYWLTVGPVRGFALYLGLATMIDLVASYFFMRPAVILLARNRRLRDRPGWFSLPAQRTTEATA